MAKIEFSIPWLTDSEGRLLGYYDDQNRARKLDGTLVEPGADPDLPELGGSGVSAFADLEGDPTDNTALAQELDAKLPAITAPEEVTGNEYTFQATDNGKTLRFSSVSACAADVPVGVIQPGWFCNWVVEVGAGALTFGPSENVRSLGGSLVASAENAAGTIYCVGADDFLVVGALGTLTASVVTDFDEAVLAAVGSNLVAVTLTGTPLVGQVLTASLPAGLTGTFQMTRDGVDIPTTGLSTAGVNSFQYTLVADDAETSVNVRVSALRYLSTALDIPAEVVGGPELIATLTDNFNDNSRDVTKWEVGYWRGAAGPQTVSEQNERLEIPIPTATVGLNLSGFLSIDTFDLTAGRAYVNLTRSSTSGLHEHQFVVYTDANNSVHWRLAGTSLTARSFNGGVETTNHVVIGYSATTHAWLSFRESGGNIIFETAQSTAANPPGGGEWTVQATIAKPAGLILDSVRVALNAGSNGSTGTPGIAKYDGFNGAA